MLQYLPLGKFNILIIEMNKLLFQINVYKLSSPMRIRRFGCANEHIREQVSVSFGRRRVRK